MKPSYINILAALLDGYLSIEGAFGRHWRDIWSAITWATAGTVSVRVDAGLDPLI